MAYEFYVLMQRRQDGKQYADLHKTTERIFFTEAEANAALSELGDLAEHFSVVPMVAMLAADYYQVRK